MDDLSSVIDSLAAAGSSAYIASQAPAQPVKTVGAGSLAGVTGSSSSLLLLIIVVIVGWFAFKAIK